MSAVEIVFWVSLALLVYTQLGYGVLLIAWSRLRGVGRPGASGGASAGARPPGSRVPAQEQPIVSLIVAAHDEQEVIAAKVAERARPELAA